MILYTYKSIKNFFKNLDINPLFSKILKYFFKCINS